MRRHNSDSVGNNGESSSSPNAQMEMSYTAVQPGIYCKEFWSYWINPTRQCFFYETYLFQLKGGARNF